MKPILFLKWLDVVVQVLAFVGPLVWCIGGQRGEGILIGWVALGGTQTLSCIVNRVGLAKDYRANSRLVYECICLIILVVAFIVLVLHPGGTALGKVIEPIYWSIVAVSPALAIWYFIISFREIQLINKHHENDVII